MECDMLVFCFLKPDDFCVALSPAVATSTMKLKYSYIVIETVLKFIHVKKKPCQVKFVCTMIAAGKFLFLVLSP